MWLVLDESLTQLDPSEPNVRSALEQLLYAIGRGEHVMAATPAVTRHLLSAELSPLPKTVLRQVLDMAPDLLSRLQGAQYRVWIVAEGANPARIDQFEWELPLEWIRDNGVPMSCVLGENMRDAELFRISAEHHRVLARTGNAVRLDVASGGGADTPRVLAAEITNQRRFVLCVTDSDRSCPSAPQNHTSNECARLSSSANWITGHHVLVEREVENLLPLNIVDDALEAMGPSEMTSRLTALKEVASNSPEIWAYLDLKEGTPLKAKFGPCASFWESVKEHQSCYTTQSDCIAEKKCLATSKVDCKCLLAPPLGQRIPDHVCAYLAQRSIHSAATRASTSVNAERWVEIGALVGEWGAAIPKLRS